jgi:hypothetical protein
MNQFGNNVTDIGSLFGDLDFYNYSLWLCPTPGLIPERVVAFYRFPILPKFPLCTHDGYICQFMQLNVPAQSGNITGIVLAIAPLHEICICNMAINPDDDYHIGLLLLEVANDLQ